MNREMVVAMTRALTHRGPDSEGYHFTPGVGLGARRLRIIDLQTGDQPIFNEDRNLVLICNGEIFNYRELRAELEAKGHFFTTRTDVEVIVHLYEELGTGLLERLNGQFAFCLCDLSARCLFLARDPFGVNPLFFTVAGGKFLFGSEIKAILQHSGVERRVDFVGLDQVLSLPGLVSPRTIVEGVESLPPGHFILVADGDVRVREYWDLIYPLADEIDACASEASYVEVLRQRLTESVQKRLMADVPVGLYLSGGIDSGLIAALCTRLSPATSWHSFSVTFPHGEIDESRYQRLMAQTLGSQHREVRMTDDDLAAEMQRVVYHAECPLKETFNVCALGLSAAVAEAGKKVILAGQGADELFGGYPGYRFDSYAADRSAGGGWEVAWEAEERARVWGEAGIFYENGFTSIRDLKIAFYGPALRECLDAIDCFNHPLVRIDRLRGRHPLHQRSYLDLKLRLADHLLSDHGDRMVMANSVEGRYPFLDLELVDYLRTIPPELHIKNFTAKHLVRSVGRGLVPRRIAEREKFGFRAPGSPMLLRQGREWIDDLLSYELNKRLGVFDAEVVEELKENRRLPGGDLNPHLEADLLVVVLTFNTLVEQFGLSTLG